MIHLMFVANKTRNKPAAGVPETRPLSARSILLSALLGTHPPQLPAAALVAFVELFGRPGGTARTALSRLVAAEDLTFGDGVYCLGPRLVARQALQDAGRKPHHSPWSGEWVTAITTRDQRSVADRRTFRSSMQHHRFGELRPDIWMRPTDQPLVGTGDTVSAVPPTPVPDVLFTVGPVIGMDDVALTGRLWPLSELDRRAQELLTMLDKGWSGLDGGPLDVLPDAFTTSAAVVRHLLSEPMLPAELQPDTWHADELRTTYDRFEHRLQERLREFFRHASARASFKDAAC